MIELKLTADTPHQLQQEMLALLAGTSTNVAAPPTQTAAAATSETAPAKRGRKPKGEGSAEGNASGAPAESTATTQAATTSVASATSDGPLTRDALANKLMLFSQKAGPQALEELWTEFGIKKLSELPEDKYQAVAVRVDELMPAEQ